jgi:hypothetical protein
MARYKNIDTSPRFIAVDLERQLLPGSFEHALNHLIDHELDLSGFDTRYKNDLTGAPAYPPAMLLKVILFAYEMPSGYSQGIVSSRGIERACREHITFIALSGDSALHLTEGNPRGTHRSPASFPTWATPSPNSSPKSSTCATGKALSVGKCSPSTASNSPAMHRRLRAAPVPTMPGKPASSKPPPRPCARSSSRELLAQGLGA